MNNQNPIEIYQAQDGTTHVEVRFEKDTVWLSLQQMADLFGRDKSVISRHLRNIYNDGELDRKSTVAKNATVQIEGKRQINRIIEYYNLDVIISVGYRVNSILGTKFRIWATARLKEYLTQGYTINQQRLKQNAHELEQALALIQKTANSSALTLESGRGLVDIVSRYTHTFLWLQQYDEGLLAEPKTQQGGMLPTYSEACSALAELKAQLMAKGEASDLFGRERDNGLSAILGNLDQVCLVNLPIQALKQKPHIYCILSSKTILFQTVINVAERFYLWISYIEMGVCLIIMVIRLSMIPGLLHSHY